MYLRAIKFIAISVSEDLTEMYFNSVGDMHAFRRFIRGTMGERILNFWQDAERYRRQVKPENRRYVFRELQNKYLKGGAPFELTDTMKWMSLCGGVRGIEAKSFTAPGELSKKLCGKNIAVFSENIFSSLQKLVIKRLRTYWVPKFVLHREKIRKRVKGRWRSIKGDLVDGDKEEAAKLAAIRELTKIKEDQIDKAVVDAYMEAHKTVSDESINEEDVKKEAQKQLLERWKEWFWRNSRAESRHVGDDEYFSSSGGSRVNNNIKDSSL